MWRSATDSRQKKAILEHLVPLTKDDFVDAVIAFSEDEDHEIRETAFKALRSVEMADLIKRASGAAPERTIRVLTRYCTVDAHPGLVARLVATRRLSWELVEELWLRPQDDLWRALIANRAFVLLSHPAREKVASFLTSFNRALADQYREQVGWVTDKDIADFDRKSAPEEPTPESSHPEETPIAGEFTERVSIRGIDSLVDGLDEVVDAGQFAEVGDALDVSGALFDTGQEVVTEDEEIIDLDSIELDVPDFMLVDEAFDGLSREDLAMRRDKIAEIIKSLNMGQLIKLATVGNMEVRKILIKDPRRMVAMAVLGNGGITPGEIAVLAGNPMTMQDVVEHIASNRNLSKSYVVKFSLVMNPKTPVKIAMKYLEVVRRGDLKKVTDNKNVSPLLRNMAKKRMM